MAPIKFAGSVISGVAAAVVFESLFPGPGFAGSEWMNADPNTSLN